MGLLLITGTPIYHFYPSHLYHPSVLLNPIQAYYPNCPGSGEQGPPSPDCRLITYSALFILGTSLLAIAPLCIIVWNAAYYTNTQESINRKRAVFAAESLPQTVVPGDHAMVGRAAGYLGALCRRTASICTLGLNAHTHQNGDERGGVMQSSSQVREAEKLRHAAQKKARTAEREEEEAQRLWDAALEKKKRAARLEEQARRLVEGIPAETERESKDREREMEERERRAGERLERERQEEACAARGYGPMAYLLSLSEEERAANGYGHMAHERDREVAVLQRKVADLTKRNATLIRTIEHSKRRAEDGPQPEREL